MMRVGSYQEMGEASLRKFGSCHVGFSYNGYLSGFPARQSLEQRDELRLISVDVAGNS